MTLALNLPYHLYGYVRRSFLSDGQQEGLEPAVWFGVTCPVNRAFGLNVLLECGALYRELPPHAWAFRPDAPVLTLGRCQAWDCFGGTAQAIEYAYLRELPVQMIADKAKGGYLFTVEWGDNGFSRYPEQSKALHALSMYGGVTFQPGNAFTVYESSFTAKDGDCSWLRRQRHAWGAEGDSQS